MMAVAFNTLTYVQRLEKGGVSHESAVTQAEALAEAIETTLVTKDDLKSGLAEMRGELKSEVAVLRGEMRTGFAELRGEFKVDIEKAKTTMIIWLVGLTVISTAAQIASRAFLH